MSELNQLADRLEQWSLDLSVGRSCTGADQDVREAAIRIRYLDAVAMDLQMTCDRQAEEIEWLRFGDKQVQDLWAIDRDDLAKAEAKLREAVEVLAYYGDQMCELHQSHECCGKLTDYECAGCKARAFLATMEKPRDS